MILHKIKPIVIGLSALVLYSTGFAQVTHKGMVCPSIDTIHAIAPSFNSSDKLSDTIHLVKSPEFASNGSLWRASAYVPLAKNGKAARKIAQDRASKVSVNLYPFVRQLYSNQLHIIGAGEQYCFYYDGSLVNPSVAVMAEIVD